MASKPAVAPVEGLEGLIHTVRGHRVMLDSDLARIYGVLLKRLNEQVRRNPDRFPRDFAFQHEREEVAILKSQFAASSSHGGRRLIEPPLPEDRREIGFHAQETPPPYRVRPHR